MKITANRIQKILACLEANQVDPAIVAKILAEGEVTTSPLTTSACSTEAETLANTIRVACDTLGDVTFGARV
ncbi:MAG: hypothetical protein GDA40_05815 [Rhodobacteraceae bacterium]|nr:hypothetical protein [Paracoccaceae bacterium]